MEQVTLSPPPPIHQSLHSVDVPSAVKSFSKISILQKYNISYLIAMSWIVSIFSCNKLFCFHQSLNDILIIIII